jgi:predicted hydrocarbon binding protein
MKEKVEKFLREEGVILPKNFVVEVYSQILKVAGPFAGLIRRGSFEAGRSAARAFKENSNLEGLDIQKLAELIGVFFKSAGFGEIESSVEGESIRVFVKDSFLLKAHNDESKALSPLIGALEGFVSECYGKPVKVEVKGREIKITYEA